jgi:hypothetical protein
MSGKEAETKLRKEFDRQVDNLVQKGYPKVAGVKAKEFLKHIEPLEEKIRELATLEREAKEERIPFVIVVNMKLMASPHSQSSSVRERNPPGRGPRPRC